MFKNYKISFAKIGPVVSGQDETPSGKNHEGQWLWRCNCTNCVKKKSDDLVPTEAMTTCPRVFHTTGWHGPFKTRRAAARDADRIAGLALSDLHGHA